VDQLDHSKKKMKRGVGVQPSEVEAAEDLLMEDMELGSPKVPDSQLKRGGMRI